VVGIVISELSVVSIEAAAGGQAVHHELKVPSSQNRISHNVVDGGCWDIPSGQSPACVERGAIKCLLPWDDHVSFPEFGDESDNIGPYAIVS